MHNGIKSWGRLVVYAFNAFSIPLLFRTLISPWQMDTAEGSKFNFFERLIFSMFSRFLGFIGRITYISFGLIFTLVVIITFPIFLIVPINISREYLFGAPSFGASLSFGETYFLSKHSREVTAPSSLKVYGKEKTMRMIERGMDKDTNHNILLVGESGVGKSVVISYLGRLSRSGLSFHGIRNHRVVELSLEGMNLDDFDKSMNEAAKSGNVVIVIENIHGFESVYERLMKYLPMKHLGIITTTNFSGYDQVLKKHPEFLSKFEKVTVLPTSKIDTMEVLKNHAHINKIHIANDALAELINLADKYIGNEPEPQKSILILEELKTLHRKIKVEDVRQVISDKTNIPIGVIGTNERAALVGLEDRMQEKIIGQSEAVKGLAEAMKRLRTGIANPGKPAGSFLFLGPTGVGKTYTAKILAESYFGRKDSMIRFDMSEFAMPGSVGLFSDRLASVIEESPLSLVFLDELEKGNQLIHHLLLQVLDEGQLTRQSGRVAKFTESIIIATSNAGSADIIANPNIDKKTLIDGLIASGIFAPEFLNRFSEIVLFKPLNAGEVRQVTELLLREFGRRLSAEKKINLVITEALIDKVATVGFDPEFGARPINRAIEEIVENKVAEFILAGNTGGDLKIL